MKNIKKLFRHINYFIIKIMFVFLLLFAFSNNSFAQKGGYTNRISVTQGDNLTFYISSEVPKFVINFFRLGKSPTFITTSDSITGSVQAVSSTAYKDGANWSPSLVFPIPLTWQTGVYRAEFKITANPDTVGAIIFVVKNKTPGTFSKTLFILSTNTWNAYNSFGGKSLYSFNSTNGVRSFKVSFTRPFDQPLGLFGAPDFPLFGEKFINWAANNNILIETVSMYDLDVNPNLLSNYDIVFIVGHNEYWSRAERRQVDNFITSGGKLISLSGNTSWWQARFEDNGNTLVSYKDKNVDPFFANGIDSLVTVNWWDTPVNYPANITFGTDFREGGFVNSPPFLSKNDGYGDYAAFNTHYWIFEGTNLKEGDEFGFDKSIVGYEADGALFFYNNGIPNVIDTLNEPLNYRIFGVSPTRRIATAKVPFGHATMGIFTNTNGGAVFNAATIRWVNGLNTDVANNVIPDSSVDRITKNVYFKFKANTLPPDIVSWTPFSTFNDTINFDPVVINSRDMLLLQGKTLLLSIQTEDPRNLSVNYAWQVDGTNVGTNSTSYNFTNNATNSIHKVYKITAFAFNSVDTSSISWNIANTPLVISSTPVKQVEQNGNYVYQVTSFNLTGDTLTYSLESPTPNWLAINPLTGKITGTAPSLTQQITILVKVIDQSGNTDTQTFNVNVVTGIETVNTIPKSFKLLQNYPNPFNPETAISYRLSAFSKVSLKIYDILGKEVATLVNKEQSAGSYSVKFKANSFASGVYLYRLTATSGANTFTQVKKMVLLK